MFYLRLAFIWTTHHSWLLLSQIFDKDTIDAPSTSDPSSTPHPFFRLPVDVWTGITDYLDARALWALGAASPSTYALLHSPRAVSSLKIALRQRCSIKVTTWPQHWISSYPSLTSLSISLNGHSAAKLEAKDLQALGDSLQHLYLRYCDNISDAMLPFLPPFLKSLHLTGNMIITDAGIPALPETLESFHLPANHLISSACLQHLPKGLTSLSIRTKDCINASMMHCLPLSITDITLTGLHPPPIPSLAVVPPFLVSFNWDYGSQFKFTEEHASVLPWSLRSLTVLSMATPNRTLGALPRSLTRLVIRSEASKLDATGIMNLPPHLSHLELMSNRELPDSALPHLPRCLSTLIMPQHADFKPDALSSLPKSITMLRLPSNNWFSDSLGHKLPPQLNTLSCIWNDEITSNFWYRAPATLQRLELKVAPEFHPSCAIPVLANVQRVDRSSATLYGSCFDIFTLHSKNRVITSVEVYPSQNSWGIKIARR